MTNALTPAKPARRAAHSAPKRFNALQTAPRRGNVAPKLAEHPAAVFVASKAPGSQRTYREALDKIAALLQGKSFDEAQPGERHFVEWSALRHAHTAAIRAQITARYSAATANKNIS